MHKDSRKIASCRIKIVFFAQKFLSNDYNRTFYMLKGRCRWAGISVEFGYNISVGSNRLRHEIPQLSRRVPSVLLPYIRSVFFRWIGKTLWIEGPIVSAILEKAMLFEIFRAFNRATIRWCRGRHYFVNYFATSIAGKMQFTVR